ncbi:MAG: hypothetical protein OEW60_05250 [Thiovulaceae bacterium]|nr:hypothetical protein [Sulfurimonadaceae bacterium]
MITTISKLLSAMHRDRKVFETLFEKRHTSVAFHEIARDIGEDRLNFLVNTDLIVQNDEHIEINERVLTFFEDFLETNSDVEIGDIDELLENLVHHINLHQNVGSYELKERYLSRIQRVLKKVPNIILKNLSLLQLHIGLTYKTQTAYENKITELKHYKTKLEKLMGIEQKVEKLLHDEDDFFKTIYSHETVMLVLRLKGRMRELRVSLIELQKQVIEYINKSLQNQAFFEHMIRLKELKSTLELKERTNIYDLVEVENTPISLNKREFFSTFLETDYIYGEDFEEIVEKIKLNKSLPTREVKKAAAVEDSFFESNDDEASMIDTDALHEQFIVQDKDLFTFVQDREFSAEKSFEQRIEIYCQMALMYEDLYYFDNHYDLRDDYEYLMIYAKESA